MKRFLLSDFGHCITVLMIFGFLCLFGWFSEYIPIQKKQISDNISRNTNTSINYNKDYNDIYTKALEVQIELQNLKKEKEALELLLSQQVINNSNPAKSSAYTSSPDETDGDPFTTSTGETPIPDKTVAVSRDLSHLLGKYIYILNFGVYYVNDTMHARWVNKIDFHKETKLDAFQHGVRRVQYIVLSDAQVIEDAPFITIDDVENIYDNIDLSGGIQQTSGE
jgi:3D (Asp-Asp-Asp) domain-containing protein